MSTTRAMRATGSAILAAASLALGGAARADTLTAFHTPSGNIHCLGLAGEGGAVMDCEIIESDAPLQPRPAGCDLDWGHRFLVTEVTPGEMVCAGDTVRDPHGAVLPYGSSLGLGRITCTSTREGLECVNPSGHGFFLSRRQQRVF